MNVKKLLRDREIQYGNTHELAGNIMGGELKKPFIHLLDVAPQISHNWVLMLSKLIRILFDPYHIDNYDDIIGYATLCRDMVKLEGE